MQKNVFTNHFICILAAVAVLMTFSCGGLLTSEKAKLEKGTIRVNLPETGARIGASKDDVDYYLISIVSEDSGTIAASSGKYTGDTFQTKVLPGSYSVIVQGIDEDDSRYGDIKWPLFIGRTNGVTVTADKESTAQIKMKLFELHASGTTYLSARDLEYFDWGSGKLPELPYPFDGWYTDRSCTKQITEFPATDSDSFACPYLNFNNNLTYKLHDTVEIMEPGTDGSAGTDATYVLFGDFPQSKHTGQSIDFTFDKKPSYNGWYVGSDGNYYAKVEDEYFLVEPIKWRVLERDYDGKGNSLLFAENVLTTGVPFYETSRDGPANSNNYEYSQIRAYLNGTSYTSSLQENYDGDDNVWLNKGFLQTAFTKTAREAIITTLIDNSTENEDFRCSDTNDKIFLLSFGEVTNANYGFQSASSEEDSVRSRNATAYVAALEGIDEEPSKYPYFLRSPSDYYYSERTSAVSASGKIERGPLVYDPYGVVPALCITIDGLPGTFYASSNGTGDGRSADSPTNVSGALTLLSTYVSENPGKTPTLYLLSDVTLPEGCEIYCNVTIIGAGGENRNQQVSVYGGGTSGPIVKFDANRSYTVKNVQIQGVNNTRVGIKNYGNLNLYNCDFFNCSISVANLTTGNCIMDYCLVQNCGGDNVDYHGIANYGVLTITGSLICGCTTASTGAGIFCSGSSASLNISESSIQNCNATSAGGGIYIARDVTTECTIDSCLIGVENDENDACTAQNGGGVCHYGAGILYFKDCIISGCKAIGSNPYGFGGGIYTAGPIAYQGDTRITNCTAELNGNSIYCYADSSNRNATISYSSSIINPDSSGNPYWFDNDITSTESFSQ